MRRSIGAIAITALLATPLLAACSGEFAQSRLALAGTDGTNASVGDGILIRDAFVLLPSTSVDAGSTASLHFMALNQGTSGDQLVRASADVAGSASVVSETVVPARSPESLGTTKMAIALDALTKPLHIGQVVTVTVGFSHAGDATFDVPVVGDAPEYSPYLISASPTSESPLASATPGPVQSPPAEPSTSPTPSEGAGH